jgi:hypothetical protein
VIRVCNEGDYEGKDQPYTGKLPQWEPELDKQKKTFSFAPERKEVQLEEVIKDDGTKIIYGSLWD